MQTILMRNQRVTPPPLHRKPLTPLLVVIPFVSSFSHSFVFSVLNQYESLSRVFWEVTEFETVNGESVRRRLRKWAVRKQNRVRRQNGYL
jgi:hypothetical protein